MSYKREQIICTERAHIKNRKETTEIIRHFGTVNKIKFKHRGRFNLQQVGKLKRQEPKFKKLKNSPELKKYDA